MKLLNLGCGYPRIKGEEWTNLDNLRSQLAEGTPERENLDAETNYVEHDLFSGQLPFGDVTFDGILASHVFEHMDCQQAVTIMRDCRRVLVPGGCLLVSVPNATYFRQVFPEDTNRNWQRLFDQDDPANTIPTFFEAALWYNQHRVLFTEDVLWCYLTHAGFTPVIGASSIPAVFAMAPHLNRRKFSLEMIGVK